MSKWGDGVAIEIEPGGEFIFDLTQSAPIGEASEKKRRPRGGHTGKGREYAVLDSFVDAGFWYIKAHRSGQAIKNSYALSRIPGDLFVWHPKHGGFQVEVGGVNKRIVTEVERIKERLLVGFVPLIVVFRRGKREYCLGSRDRFSTLDDLLDALENR